MKKKAIESTSAQLEKYLPQAVFYLKNINL
jgi:hypothetical protein